MKYLGLDVHERTTHWCVLDEKGDVLGRGKTDTTAPALTGLVAKVGAEDDVMAGQEVGCMSHFVHDVFALTKARLLSFNAHHLRVIAASRKKTDRRDAYWLAKSLQTGMMPNPVYIPTGQIRELRACLTQREALMVERQRWLLRARKSLVAIGCQLKRRTTIAALNAQLDSPDGLPDYVVTGVRRCLRLAAVWALRQSPSRISLPSERRADSGSVRAYMRHRSGLIP